MAVGISYTGVDGKVTTFKSESADDALIRLRKIGGYLPNEMDKVALNLASAWKKRSARRQLSENAQQNTTLNRNLKEVEFVTDIGSGPNGGIKATRRKCFITESGAIIPTNGTSTVVI